MIGIVGGVGPLAGIDIVQKIIEETKANKDQDHLSVLLFSLPCQIPDRTEYLVGKIQESPATSITSIIKRLSAAGATYAAIPCNTAHAPLIFDQIQKNIEEEAIPILLISMIEYTVKYIQSKYPGKKVGILSTTGTWKEGIYRNALRSQGIEIVEPDEVLQTQVHAAIYDKAYGIKAQSSPVNPKAVAELEKVATVLASNGAEVLILGCTELPLAFTEQSWNNIPLIDPNRILARSLIGLMDPSKLRDY